MVSKRQMLKNRLLHKTILTDGSIAKENVNLKNFNPLDGQILGVFQKERKDGGEDVQILEIKKELETNSADK